MYIIFEGPDGSGKSTVAQEVINRLNAMNLTSLVVRQPGTTQAGEAIRGILKGGINMHPLTRQALHMADTAELNIQISELEKKHAFFRPIIDSVLSVGLPNSNWGRPHTHPELWNLYIDNFNVLSDKTKKYIYDSEGYSF